jgi:hypothetical protein
MSKKMDNRRENFVALGRDAIEANDIPVPEKPKKYAVVEVYVDDTCNIQDVETHQDAARFINNSETEHTLSVVYDLDNPNKFWVPVMRVFRFARLSNA